MSWWVNWVSKTEPSSSSTYSCSFHISLLDELSLPHSLNYLLHTLKTSSVPFRTLVSFITWPLRLRGDLKLILESESLNSITSEPFGTKLRFPGNYYHRTSSFDWLRIQSLNSTSTPYLNEVMATWLRWGFYSTKEGIS